jgi:hypothetical protein
MEYYEAVNIRVWQVTQGSKIVHTFNFTLLYKQQKRFYMCGSIYLEKNGNQCYPIELPVSEPKYSSPSVR